MTEQFRDAPIFGADRHMYETADALTKFLPEKYERANGPGVGMDVRRTYDFMGDNARRFTGLPIANPDPGAVNPPALVAPGGRTA